MKRGYMKIKENEAKQLIIEAKLENGSLWMTKYEIAYLFNVVANSISNTIRALFKSGILREENVTQIHKFTLNGKINEVVLYNLEAIIHIGFRVSSFEAKFFREWIAGGFCEYLKMGKLQASEVLIVLSNNSKIPLIASLN